MKQVRDGILSKIPSASRRGSENFQAMAHQRESSPEALTSKAIQAMESAYLFASKIMRPDGHWYGEMRSNATITAEYVLLLQALGIRDETREEPLRRYLLSQQNDDGSWSFAPECPGNASTTTEAYLALKIMGLNTDNSLSMRKAQSWMQNSADGGVERVQVLTRIYLAMFGLLPWTAMPQLPPELILLPPSSPINVYKLASWARSTLVPMLVLCHHRPTFALPNGLSSNNDFLDEIWRCPEQKNIPYGESIVSLIGRGDLSGCAFTLADTLLWSLGGLRTYNPLRRYAIGKCVEWIKTRQEPSGDFAGIWPPMPVSILVYKLEGYTLDSAPIRKGLEAVERFAWIDHQGKRIQACVSPVWDTVLMSIALSETGDENTSEASSSHPKQMRKRGLAWIRDHQLYGHQGDWRVYRPQLSPGCFSFEYHNSWYPDIDDTAAAIIAFLKDDRHSVTASHVLDAAKWVLDMQSRDGGWAAFDVDNDKLYLNKIPFSDMDSLCDPSTSDIVGRVLEAFGLFLLAAEETGAALSMRSFLGDIRVACRRGLDFLLQKQELNGAWFGRWGVNYIYGTSNVLAALAYHCFPDENHVEDGSVGEKPSSLSRPVLLPVICPALRFLTSIQNADGGWGEAIATYRLSPVTNENAAEVKKLCSAPSTPAQTAWAIIGLLPYVSTDHPSIQAGIQYLIKQQNIKDLASRTAAAELDPAHETDPSGAALTWSTDKFTGTGFPNHFYLGYTLYSHYFPMMAIGEYLRAGQQEAAGTKFVVDFE